MRRSLVGLIIVAGVVLGLLHSPRLLEPGRAERNGTVLKVGSPKLAPDKAGDWYFQSSRTSVVDEHGALVVSSQLPGVQLVSRPIPVFPGRCYALTADIASFTDGTSLLVMNEAADTTLLQWLLEASTVSRTRTIVFTSHWRRVSIGLLTSNPDSSLAVVAVRLAPVNACRGAR